jgi:phytoene dehydrogenase-like protein
MNTAFPELQLHNIFFSNDYKNEFDVMFKQGSISNDPTVYIFVSSKEVPEDAPLGQENWFVMVNAPHHAGQDWPELIGRTREAIIQKISRMLGKNIAPHIVCEEILDPPGIERHTSSRGGSLYGNSSNSKWAAFMRHPNFFPRIQHLYTTGGSVHPGGGIPLCLLSAKIVGDLVSGKV